VLFNIAVDVRITKTAAHTTPVGIAAADGTLIVVAPIFTAHSVSPCVFYTQYIADSTMAVNCDFEIILIF
jgi:hypothetical protein